MLPGSPSILAETFLEGYCLSCYRITCRLTICEEASESVKKAPSRLLALLLADRDEDHLISLGMAAGCHTVDCHHWG